MVNQRYLKYGIAALLAATAVAASILAGYQNGFAVGKSDGFDSKIVSRPHYVGPLAITLDAKANAKQDYTSLINFIKSTTSTDLWKNPANSIEPYPLNHSLIVAQTVRGHAEIEDLLNKLRDAKKTTGLTEQNDHRIENGLCLQCGHGIFTKSQTFSSNKFYSPKCSRCGHVAPWLAPLNDPGETPKAPGPAG